MSALNPNHRYCPYCGSLGATDDLSGMQICTANRKHRFWAASRRCSCGFIPVIPAEGDVWVCVNCDVWEPAR